MNKKIAFIYSKKAISEKGDPFEIIERQITVPGNSSAAAKVGVCGVRGRENGWEGQLSKVERGV